MGREVTLKIFRYNPQDKNDKPRFQEYKLEETTGMTLFIALNLIRENQDPTLAFDFVCRAGICGSCGMLVNGVPTLACRTLINNYKENVITVTPMAAFKLIKDLSVDTGTWMNAMSKRVESWVHSTKEVDMSKIEAPMDPDLANDVFELDRCIECGICVAACGTKIMRPDFIGAVGLNRVARFQIDPHDERTDADYFELVGDDDGIFGCMSLLGCEDNCPKHLPLQTQIAYLRRKLVAQRK